MSITTPVPENIRGAFESGLGNFLGEPVPARFRASVGIEVFTLPVDDLAAGRKEMNPRPAGWLFLTGASPGEIMAAEVYEPGRGAEPKVVNVSRDPVNEKIRRMVQGIERLPQMRAADYELRVLRIPAISVEAFWLKAAKKGQADLVVPFFSLSHHVRTGQTYPVDGFLEAILPLRERTNPRTH